jgi:hypothetical protein
MTLAQAARLALMVALLWSGVGCASPTQTTASDETSASEKQEPTVEGLPAFDEPRLVSVVERFEADKRRALADPNVFLAADPQVDCPIAPALHKQVVESLKARQKGWVAKGEAFDVSHLKIRILEGACPDGVLSGPGRYLARYRTHRTTKEGEEYYYQRDVVVSAKFDAGRAVEFYARFEKARLLSEKGDVLPQSEENPYRHSCLYFVEPYRPDKAKQGRHRSLLFIFSLTSPNKTVVTLQEPLDDGRIKRTWWLAKHKYKSETWNADGELIDQWKRK